MRNKIIESTIDQVIDQTQYGHDFKRAFKQFIKNKFDNNANDIDLKKVLACIEEIEEDTSSENVDY